MGYGAVVKGKKIKMTFVYWREEMTTVQKVGVGHFRICMVWERGYCLIHL